MLVIRLAKILMVAALAAFAFLAAYDNVVDYGANYEFVRHVLSMDTIFPDDSLKHRAITDPRLWRAAYSTHHPAAGPDPLPPAHGGRAPPLRARAPRA